MWIWDWPAAEREFRRATELDPNYGPAHHWYALYLAAMGREGESVKEIQSARRLDPLSPNVNAAVGYVYYFARKYDQSIKECQEVLRQKPDFMVAHAVLGLAYESKGTYENAIAELQRAIELSGDRTSAYLGWLGHVYAVSGRRAEAEKILNELDDLAKRGFVGSTHRAVIYVALGEKDKALQSLLDARDQDDAAMIWLRVDPHYDVLRADSRFQELLKTQGNAR
jgi:tetratricopeptide (TPR) repeat protein